MAEKPLSVRRKGWMLGGGLLFGLGAALSGAGAVVGEFALVEEGDGEEHGAEDEEGEDAIDAREEGEVEEEDFGDDDAEKDEGLPAEKRRMALNAEEKQETSVAGPEDGEGKMLRERVIGGRGDAAEVVPEFEAE